MKTDWMKTADPLTDPRYDIPRKESTPLDVLIHEAHYRHMQRIDQQGWVNKLFTKMDHVKKTDMRNLRKYMQKQFPEHGKHTA